MHSLLRLLAVLFVVCQLLTHDATAAAADATRPRRPSPGARSTHRTASHEDNWAVLINVSRFWFNYRHAANVLSMYRTVKRLGIPDERIIMMNGDDYACNGRNAFPSEVHNNKKRDMNLYGDNVEVDYRSYDVTLDNIVRVLTDRHPPSTPRSRRLLSDSRSNVLLYITGHGGDEFMKIQDHEEISAQDIAAAVAQMHQAGRFKELFMIFETCQAATMFARVNTPGAFLASSSKRGESSYSHHSDGVIGLSVIDRFTYFTLQFFERVKLESNATIQQWYSHVQASELSSTLVTDDRLVGSKPAEMRVTEFFGYIAPVSVTSAFPMPLV